jgi:hypothetical protein
MYRDVTPVRSFEYQPTFRRNMSPPSSRFKYKPCSLLPFSFMLMVLLNYFTLKMGATYAIETYDDQVYGVVSRRLEFGSER